MSDANEELQAQVTAIGEHTVAQGEMLETLQSLVIDQMSEITALFTTLSMTMAALPAEKRGLVEKSLSDLLRDLPNRELAGKLHAILQQRLHLRL